VDEDDDTDWDDYPEENIPELGDIEF